MSRFNPEVAYYASIAQWIERPSTERKVGSSNLSRGAAKAMEVCQSGLMGITANDERGKSRRRFESCHFRVNENIDYRKSTVEYLEEELDLLYRTKIAILKSRLNAGLLVIPEGLQVWNSEVEDEPDIVDELVDALTKPVEDTVTDMSFLPIILRGPAELVREVKHLKFSRDESVEVIQDRIDVIENRLDMYRNSLV